MTTMDPASQTYVGDTASRPAGIPALLILAALASLGAGGIHAVAVGVHASATQAMWAFTAVAVLQVGWAIAVLVRPGRAVAAAGVAVNVGALAGFVVAKTSGLAFIDGLEEAEAVELGDGMAASLAMVAILAATRFAISPVRAAVRRTWAAPAIGVLALALAIPGMAAAARPGHHADGGGADHSGSETAAASADHHGANQAVGTTGDDHNETAAAKPYDPAAPIDLGGTPGVTPTEQARAENLIASTLHSLPVYEEPSAAEAAGFSSIGDGVTGYEHFINWSYVTDGQALNPDRPESLVYQVRNGEKTLVAAMFMASPGTTLDDTPELGGALTQWHIHDNLCFSNDPEAPRVAGLTDVQGGCRPPTVKLSPVPMIHVWTVPHPCGPFAALEGVAGGQIKEGEERLCDEAHGAH